MNRGVIIGLHLQEIGLRLQRAAMPIVGEKTNGLIPLTEIVGWSELRDIQQDLKVLHDQIDSALYPDDAH